MKYYDKGLDYYYLADIFDISFDNKVGNLIQPKLNAIVKQNIGDLTRSDNENSLNVGDIIFIKKKNIKNLYNFELDTPYEVTDLNSNKITLKNLLFNFPTDKITINSSERISSKASNYSFYLLRKYFKIGDYCKDALLDINLFGSYSHNSSYRIVKSGLGYETLISNSDIKNYLRNIESDLELGYNFSGFSKIDDFLELLKDDRIIPKDLKKKFEYFATDDNVFLLPIGIYNINNDGHQITLLKLVNKDTKEKEKSFYILNTGAGINYPNLRNNNRTVNCLKVNISTINDIIFVFWLSKIRFNDFEEFYHNLENYKTNFLIVINDENFQMEEQFTGTCTWMSLMYGVKLIYANDKDFKNENWYEKRKEFRFGCLDYLSKKANRYIEYIERTNKEIEDINFFKIYIELIYSQIIINKPNNNSSSIPNNNSSSIPNNPNFYENMIYNANKIILNKNRLKKMSNFNLVQKDIIENKIKNNLIPLKIKDDDSLEILLTKLNEYLTEIFLKFREIQLSTKSNYNNSHYLDFLFKMLQVNIFNVLKKYIVKKLNSLIIQEHTELLNLLNLLIEISMKIYTIYRFSKSNKTQQEYHFGSEDKKEKIKKEVINQELNENQKKAYDYFTKLNVYKFNVDDMYNEEMLFYSPINLCMLHILNKIIMPTTHAKFSYINYENINKSSLDETYQCYDLFKYLQNDILIDSDIINSKETQELFLKFNNYESNSQKLNLLIKLLSFKFINVEMKIVNPEKPEYYFDYIYGGKTASEGGYYPYNVGKCDINSNESNTYYYLKKYLDGVKNYLNEKFRFKIFLPEEYKLLSYQEFYFRKYFIEKVLNSKDNIIKEEYFLDEISMDNRKGPFFYDATKDNLCVPQKLNRNLLFEDKLLKSYNLFDLSNLNFDGVNYVKIFSYLDDFIKQIDNNINILKVPISVIHKIKEDIKADYEKDYTECSVYIKLNFESEIKDERKNFISYNLTSKINTEKFEKMYNANTNFSEKYKKKYNKSIKETNKYNYFNKSTASNSRILDLLNNIKHKKYEKIQNSVYLLEMSNIVKTNSYVLRHVIYNEYKKKNK